MSLSNLFKNLFKKYDINGFDKSGIHKNGTRYDEQGYDKFGFNTNGYNRDGYNENGYNKFGYDKNGYNKLGYNINGYDRDGYNKNGYNKFGYNKNGYNKNGYNKSGYDINGYDINGYDKLGFNKNGRDKNGFHRDGEKEIYDSRGCLINTKLMQIVYSEKHNREIEEYIMREKSKGAIIINKKIGDGKETKWGYYNETGIFPSEYEACKIVHITTSGSKAFCNKINGYCYNYEKNYNCSNNEFESLKGLPCKSCIDLTISYDIDDWD